MAIGFNWYVHDHLYSPVALVDYLGNVKERYEYDAYGNCDILEPNFADDEDGKSDYGNVYYFTGRRVDFLNGGNLTLQYNRNRYYEYYTGRWMTHDPLGYWDGMNLYAYVGNTPINRADPLGLKNCCGVTNGVTGWGISIPIPIGPAIRAGCWVACRAAERAIATMLRGHVDDAFRNYSGMSGTREDPAQLSDSDMKDIMRLYHVRRKIIVPLVEECERSTRGWKNREDGKVEIDYTSIGLRGWWYYYDGSWGAALGNCRFYPTSTCSCRKLSWTISVKEPFDFQPLWKSVWMRPWRVFRNAAVFMTYITNNGCNCGWEPFSYEGDTSDEESIDCSAR